MAEDSKYGAIKIRGARENNLKEVSCDIPKRKITVFTGVSGSGKSSLVFGTIAAESQRLIRDCRPAFAVALQPLFLLALVQLHYQDNVPFLYFQF